MNQRTHFFCILIIAILILVIVYLAFFSTPKESQKSVQIRQEFPAGTFSLSPDEPEPKPVQIFIQGAKNGKSVQVSWDSSQLRVFHLILFDSEPYQKGEPADAIAVSGLKEIPQDSRIQEKDVVSFIPSGYVLGDEIPEILFPGKEIELATGTDYYLQLFAFIEDNKEVIINKTFTFTESCLSPDCQ